MLGERLLASGVVNSTQLQAALEQQRASRDLLGEVLLTLNFVTEHDLSKALAQEAGVPFLAIEGQRPDRSAIALVPESFARRHLVAPLGLRDAVLEVLQANPFDVIAIDELHGLTGYPAQVVCGTRSNVLHLIDRSYGVRPEIEERVTHRTPSSAVTTADSPAMLLRALDDLGLGRRNLGFVKDALSRSRGVVLVTGPADSGKTATLYSMLKYLDGREKSIFTLEDPVECEIPSVHQIQVTDDAGFTGATAIRSLLRQDPDVIMIGAIHDPETAQMAMRAALAGVLVLSTLNTTDAAGAVPCLMAMGLEPYLLASSLVAVIAQRLVRVMCPNCKTPATYPADMLAKIGLTPDPDMVLYRGQGCEHCGGTGYHGRTAAFEILPVDSAIQALILERADSPLIKAASVRAGIKTLVEDALSKALFGQTTVEEVLRAASD